MIKVTSDDFIEDVFYGADYLKRAIEFIKNNLDPDDVFSEEDLEKWAEDNGWESRR